MIRRGIVFGSYTR